MNKIIHWVLILSFTLVIIGCSDGKTPLRVGGKDYGENKLLSEMIAALAEQEGIQVQRMIGFGSTRMNLEALKSGDIDIYVDLNGTGMVMLGQQATADGDASMAKVRELYQPLGLLWGKRFGFANNYGILMLADRARELGISSLSDLVKASGTLSIGIEDEFQSRPLDGFQPMMRRYGISFDNIDVVARSERAQLYEYLLSGRVDLIEAYTTDGQIADYDVIVLQDDLEFFPVYEAAPLLRADVLERYPNLLIVLDKVAGKLDEGIMRELNRLIDLQGQSPAVVARSALADIGLLKSDVLLKTADPLPVAAAPFSETQGVIGAALHSISHAFSGRQVQLLPTQNPLAALTMGEARLALVGAHEFTRAVAGGEVGNFEAIGVAGETTLHILALQDNLLKLEDAENIAVGAPDSVSERSARMIADGLSLKASLINTGGEDAQSVVKAMRESIADVAFVVAPLGNEIVTHLIRGGARLLSLENWNQGNNMIRYPTLRQARIPMGTYNGQTSVIETLSSQLVLAAVGALGPNVVGDRGPGASYSDSAQPLSDATVIALHNALKNPVDIDPAIRQPAVLKPRLPDPPSPINPASGQSILNLAITALLIWLAWVFMRPQALD